MPFIAAMLAGIFVLLMFALADTNDASTIEWDVCDGHGAVERIVNAPDNLSSVIKCEDGSRYKLTLTVLR